MLGAGLTSSFPTKDGRPKAKTKANIASRNQGGRAGGDCLPFPTSWLSALVLSRRAGSYPYLFGAEIQKWLSPGVGCSPKD